MNDLRYAARVLAKSRGFTLTAVALLSVGIAAAVVVFSSRRQRPLDAAETQRRSDFSDDREFGRELGAKITSEACVDGAS
jgi:hypothetical protein